MSDKISAEDGAILRGASAVNETKGAIDTERRAVQDSVQQARSRWSGPAANAYLQLMERWDAQAKTINDVLIELENNLRGTASDQAATEEDHQQNIGRIAGLLG